MILGAGRAVRGGLPSAVVDIDGNGRVMDWLLAAFAELGEPAIHFVGGFKAEEVVERYPRIHTVFNREWARTGPVHSLGLAPVPDTATVWACYADVVFRPSAVAALRDAPGDVALAVDTTWRDRYEGRARPAIDAAEKVRLDATTGLVTAIGRSVATADADAEFAGLLRLGPAAATTVATAVRSGALTATATLPDLVAHLIDAGHAVTPVDLQGGWAELDARQDLARFVLGTKAESLERLRAMDHGGEIGELVAFTSAQWGAAADEVIGQILAEIPGEELIVRSSALAEDSWTESAAGAFESILHVARTPAAIRDAVEAVIASYGPDRPGNQVLVQEMLTGVAMSGVVMTRTHAVGAPYYVINFDDSTARTDTVTGGGDARTVFLHRGAPLRPTLPARLGAVISTVQNIEKLVGHDSLDVEFAVTADERVHVLQVRPIAVTHTTVPVDDEQIAAALGEAAALLAARRPCPPTQVGTRTRYSVMSDWNPAEIVGTKPGRLAFSLYRHLITDDVWAQQRAEYGYRDVRPSPLLVDVIGHPYVDVRATFSSFVPAALPEDLAHRLVDHYVDRLEAHPHLHDKVEFDILFTCLTADIHQQADRLRAAGFTEDEIDALVRALRDITVAGMARVAGDLAASADHDARLTHLRGLDLAPLDRAYHLLEEVRRHGTLTFSHLARGAFVATALLRSLVAVGALSGEQRDAFLASIETVLGRMQADARAVPRGELTWDAFVDTYGHLRPGTYDITSPCYRTAADAYLRPVIEQAAGPDHDHEDGAAAWDGPTRAAVADALRAVGLPDDVDAFRGFVADAVRGRELGKFVFTRGLSDALEALAEVGAAHGIGRERLAHVSITDLLALRDALVDPRGHLERRIEEGLEAYAVAQGVCLPGQLATADDLTCFEQDAAEPNFVTRAVAEGPVIATDFGPDAPVEGAIVLIPNADPGFDWLLARDIAGLVTMYGGANSHMAVRAAELGLPAAIGVGELLYAELEPASRIRLDCASRTIRVVH